MGPGQGKVFEHPTVRLMSHEGESTNQQKMPMMGGGGGGEEVCFEAPTTKEKETSLCKTPRKTKETFFST